MTPQQAISVVTILINAGLNPTISQDGGNWTVGVSVPQGATTAQVEGVIAQVPGITASVHTVKFV